MRLGPCISGRPSGCVGGGEPLVHDLRHVRAQVVETFREVGGVLVFVFDDGDAESLVVGSYIGGDGVQVSDYKGGELEGLVLGRGLTLCARGRTS